MKMLIIGDQSTISCLRAGHRGLVLVGLAGFGLLFLPDLARAGDAFVGTSAQSGAFLRGILPLIFIGILIYVGLRIFNHRPGGSRDGSRPPSEGPGRDSGPGFSPPPRDYSDPNDPEHLRDAYARARASWEWLSGDAGRERQAGQAGPVPSGGPAALDPDEFLEGAKAAYGRIRHSLALGDREDARQFAEDAALDALVGGAEPSTLPGEVLLVNARLLETKTTGNHTTVSVYYDATAKAIGQGQPVSLREIWRFGRDDDNPESHWRLEAVQPAETAQA